MQFDIITIFPKIFDSYFSESMMKRAQQKKKIKINIHNLRNYTTDKHQTVDDAPYGGGPGLVFKIEPIYRAIKEVKKKTKFRKRKRKIILLSAKGKIFDQKKAKELSELKNIILICPRYEGVDERVLNFVDEEISIGNYILTGGEIPAMIVVDAVTRLIPGVLGKDESSEEESFAASNLLEYPHYTRPEVFKVGKKSFRVPKVLLSGNHKEIERWRRGKMKQVNN